MRSNPDFHETDVEQIDWRRCRVCGNLSWQLNKKKESWDFLWEVLKVYVGSLYPLLLVKVNWPRIKLGWGYFVQRLSKLDPYDRHKIPVRGTSDSLVNPCCERKQTADPWESWESQIADKGCLSTFSADMILITAVFLGETLDQLRWI